MKNGEIKTSGSTFEKEPLKNPALAVGTLTKEPFGLRITS